MGFWIQITNR